MSPEYHKQYYRNNKDKWKLDTQEKRDKHNESMKKGRLKHGVAWDENSRQWRSTNYARVLFNQTRRGATARNLDWDLTLDDIVIPTHCPYLGVELTATQGEGVVWTNASVDRIDNEKGYIKGNIQIISRLANSMKQHATEEQLIAFAKGVLAVHSKAGTGPC